MILNSSVLVRFPYALFVPDLHLMKWHPRGILDDQLAERIVDFMELEEFIADAPFDRYIDLGRITEVHFKVAHTFWLADRRRRGYTGTPVKSALVADATVTFGVARLYEELMRDSAIEVRAFRTREAAAEWLEVPLELLLVTKS